MYRSVREIAIWLHLLLIITASFGIGIVLISSDYDVVSYLPFIITVFLIGIIEIWNTLKLLKGKSDKSQESGNSKVKFITVAFFSGIIVLIVTGFYAQVSDYLQKPESTLAQDLYGPIFMPDTMDSKPWIILRSRIDSFRLDMPQGIELTTTDPIISPNYPEHWKSTMDRQGVNGPFAWLSDESHAVITEAVNGYKYEIRYKSLFLLLVAALGVYSMYYFFKLTWK